LIPDEDKENQMYKDVIGFFFESVEVRMIVSKMMIEGDPSINEAPNFHSVNFAHPHPHPARRRISNSSGGKRPARYPARSLSPSCLLPFV
jgi:hypothetical protein